MRKTKPIITKATKCNALNTKIQQRKIEQTKNYYPDLVAFYDIRLEMEWGYSEG